MMQTRVIYKRALELQLLLLPFIDIQTRPLASKLVIYQAARYIIKDLCPQLYQHSFYKDL